MHSGVVKACKRQVARPPLAHPSPSPKARPNQVELCGVVGSRQAEAVKKMSLENVELLSL